MASSVVILAALLVLGGVAGLDEREEVEKACRTRFRGLPERIERCLQIWLESQAELAANPYVDFDRCQIEGYCHRRHESAERCIEAQSMAAAELGTLYGLAIRSDARRRMYISGFPPVAGTSEVRRRLEWCGHRYRADWRSSTYLDVWRCAPWCSDQKRCRVIQACAGDPACD